MKMHITLLASALLMLSSCASVATISQSGSSQRFDDGIYYKPEIRQAPEVASGSREISELAARTKASNIYAGSLKLDTLRIPEFKVQTVNVFNISPYNTWFYTGAYAWAPWRMYDWWYWDSWAYRGWAHRYWDPFWDPWWGPWPYSSYHWGYYPYHMNYPFGWHGFIPAPIHRVYVDPTPRVWKSPSSRPSFRSTDRPGFRAGEGSGGALGTGRRPSAVSSGRQLSSLTAGTPTVSRIVRGTGSNGKLVSERNVETRPVQTVRSISSQERLDQKVSDVREANRQLGGSVAPATRSSSTGSSERVVANEAPRAVSRTTISGRSGGSSYNAGGQMRSTSGYQSRDNQSTRSSAPQRSSFGGGFSGGFSGGSSSGSAPSRTPSGGGGGGSVTRTIRR